VPFVPHLIRYFGTRVVAALLLKDTAANCPRFSPNVASLLKSLYSALVCVEEFSINSFDFGVLKSSNNKINFFGCVIENVNSTQRNVDG
jgi:hypothetical protein